ncbi:hypothetical protein Rleg9DRAFT_4128 [Rhizobium leguminosarum bv. trifolii WSM597]|uniref:Uncharacterized protein n=1 Tax=Rhizobium leguminosarum bv. trifolii WSM597 TaxID=754764 RepID=J0H595_RHILT|nr:hypothetical protein [Rhizobium leguminosarum]EJB05255.1 hypothetical protein Rleg9DRAFT_4128 [Rhizobium leguminosarum bv. trifolii WSM597]
MIGMMVKMAVKPHSDTAFEQALAAEAAAVRGNEAGRTTISAPSGARSAETNQPSETSCRKTGSHIKPNL